MMPNTWEVLQVIRDERNQPIICWSNGTYQKAQLQEEPVSALVDLFPPVCRRPNNNTHIRDIFVSLKRLPFSLQEIYLQNPERTIELLENVFRAVTKRVQTENGTRLNEMENLDKLRDLATHNETRPLQMFFERWVNILGDYPVRGPRGGVVLKRWRKK